MKGTTATFAAVAGIIVLLIGLVINAQFSSERATPPAQKEATIVTFDEEVEKVLARHMALLMPLVTDDSVLQAVSASNDRNRHIQIEDILKLDREWQDPQSTLAESILVNHASARLIAFQESYPGFSEIFITDAVGLNAAQTNKTSDYFQADESWWVQTYNRGAGLAHHGLIEFDESAQAEAVSLYLPLYSDLSKRELIGIMKAVLSVAAIKIEL